MFLIKQTSLISSCMCIWNCFIDKSFLKDVLHCILIKNAFRENLFVYRSRFFFLFKKKSILTESIVLGHKQKFFPFLCVRTLNKEVKHRAFEVN